MSSVELKNQTITISEDEPPSRSTSWNKKQEDEPPSKCAVSKNRLFAHVPYEDWINWRWQFKNRITNVDELAKYIPLSVEEQLQLRLVTIQYPMAITPYYLSLIDPDDPEDPIRKQAVPSVLEITMGSLGMEDPLEEKRDSVVPGLVHRYPDRVLMVLTNVCPMMCRHCTRKREWKHGTWMRPMEEIEAMLTYIRRHKSVRDVIISGGDPLTLSTKRLEEVISALRKINHVEIIRIGSRYPVVLPFRIDNELCDMLSEYGPIWLNTHFNNPREVTPEAAKACDRLVRAGVPVNNQSVLLRGVNDTVEIQKKLVHSLLRSKVRPYYLFQCDEVQGTEHLRTPVETGIKIIDGLRGHTSGLAIPTFVIDLPFGGGKVPLQPNYILAQDDGELLFRNYKHNLYRFRNPNNQSIAASIQNSSNKLTETPVNQYVLEGNPDADRVIV
ncbi:MAG: KamA family radical SAM protein [Dehalococcoidales bacterium]|nr:KamA family radical SAM protein [Dehalococcoidales bacterium]